MVRVGKALRPTVKGIRMIDTLRRNLYLSNIALSQVEVFRLQAEQFLPPIGVGSEPLGLALHPLGLGRGIRGGDVDGGTGAGTVAWCGWIVVGAADHRRQQRERCQPELGVHGTSLGIGRTPSACAGVTARPR